jgi:signal transduction histidine kinase
VIVVGGALVALWAMAGMALARQHYLRPLGLVVLGGAAIGGTGIAYEPTAVLVPAVGLHILLGLPHGIVAGGRRVMVVIGYAVCGTGLVVAVIGTGDVPPAALATAWLAAAVVGLPAAHTTYLKTIGLERQRLQWIGCGAVVAAEAILVVGALRVLVNWPHPAGVVAAACTAVVPLTVAAGASPRLAARADRLLVHTVSLTGLTLVTVAVYVVVVIGLGRTPDESDRALLALSMVAAGIAAALYLPARERLAEIGNRLVYGERHAPDEVLRTFGSRLSRAIPMDELLLQLAESLKKTLALKRAEVWTGTAELLELTVSVPYADTRRLLIGAKERPVVSRAGVSGQAWAQIWIPELLDGREHAQLRVAPVVHSGELLGLIVVERPAADDAFIENDDIMLTELARQVGLALHNVQLDSALQATLDEVRRANEELRASRARIVASGDAERRKIERNLHDGAQQQLVALALNIRLAKDMIARDPTAANDMLDQLAADVKETVAELRALAHGIYPPLLADAGLAEALRSAAGRSPLPVQLSTEGVGRYPSEAEAAVYFCCLEAMQNAAKHAEGAELTLTLAQDDGALVFEVTDNGPGFDVEAAVKGHGYTNMSDRLGALGGSIRWQSAPGEGSRVSGTIPIEPLDVAP